MNNLSLTIFEIPVRAIQYGIPVGLYFILSLCGTSLSHWMIEKKKIKHLSLFDNISSVIVCSSVCTTIASVVAYLTPFKYLRVGGFVGLFTSFIVCASKLLFPDTFGRTIKYSLYE